MSLEGVCHELEVTPELEILVTPNLEFFVSFSMSMEGVLT
jgi:hypothetical protein